MRGISGKKLLFGLLGIFLAAVIPAVVLPTLVCTNDGPTLDDLGTVPPFALTDERGLVFTEEGLRGHPTIVNFVFTRCDTICPAISMKMEKLQERLSDRRAEDIKLVSISVDPAHDRPEKLAVYAAQFHARTDKWRFLTGEPDKVRSLVEGPFMTSMRNEGLTPSGAPAISHNGYFVLVDANLVIRGVYDSSDIQKLDQLMHHARFLARTSRSYKFGGG
ncbi:MAG: SCO family protein [Deltaproteobacteria bacterium]|nr:SCO family protein [Deltaproteobacteria bacterium]